MRRRTVAALLLVGISGMVGCADETLPEPMPKPASLPSPEFVASVLWLPEGATTRERGFRASPVRVENGRETYEDGTAYVAFEFTGECELFAAQIEARLSERGWIPRATEFLNPGAPLNIGQGCTRRYGGVIPVGPDGPIYEPTVLWRGEWENPDGDIVECWLGGTRQGFWGGASYKPRQAAAWVRQRVEATRREMQEAHRRMGWEK